MEPEGVCGFHQCTEGCYDRTIILFCSRSLREKEPSQISRILDKIQQLTQQLKELADSSGSADEKKKQQELIQTQITVLQAQLAALQHQQAEEEQKKQEQAPGKVEGVNSPTDDHQIDIYI